MAVGNSLVAFWIPVGVNLIFDLKVFADPDELFPEFKGVFDSVLEDVNRPIVRAPFLAIHDMDSDVEFGLVGVILDNFDDFAL